MCGCMSVWNQPFLLNAYNDNSARIERNAAKANEYDGFTTQSIPAIIEAGR